MKAAPNIFPEIIRTKNMLVAARDVARGKRHKKDVGLFLFNLENEIVDLQREIIGGSYQPRPYRSFMIYEPKPRNISCSAVRDRVVHHAICNVLEPLIEKRMISDTYACRIGKGAHKAVKKAQIFCRRNEYYLS